MRMNRASRNAGFRLLLFVALSASAGCFSYSRGTQLSPGTRVGVDLTTRASADYTDRLGSTIDRLEGVLMASTADSLTLRVHRAKRLAGDWETWAGETISLPMQAVASWQQRKFSLARTAIAAGGLALMIWQLSNSGVLSGFGDRTDPEPKPIPPQPPG